MKAVVLDSFGSADELTLGDVPVPHVEAGEVLIRVEYAGVGQWDIFEREGGYAELFGMEVKFPYILGSEGAGRIAGFGEGVTDFKIGDRVYAPGFLNGKGGFYAEYVAVDSRSVRHIPENISEQEAAVVSGVGITAMRGLEDTLRLKKGESIIIVGASGGVGHLAVQLAKLAGARVFAVASGEDGVAMVRGLGADHAINGHEDDVFSEARSYAPEGFDAALITAGGEAADAAVRCIKPGGRAAYPYGVYPEPQACQAVDITGYYGAPDPEIIQRLNECIVINGLTVHIASVFPLEGAIDVHRALNGHYLGKLCLKIDR